jgi:hypothetical protein
MSDEYAGTEIWKQIRYAVPPPPVAELILTVTVAVLEVTLVATILSILLTVPVDGVNAVHVVALVLLGIKYTVVPYIDDTPTIFGFAIFSP